MKRKDLIIYLQDLPEDKCVVFDKLEVHCDKCVVENKDHLISDWRGDFIDNFWKELKERIRLHETE